jgi:hypothetical protein
MKKLIALSVLVITFASCTDATRAKLGGYGDTYTIKVMSCDTIITYKSSGKVISENGSDGYYFNDVTTGKLIEVSGTVIIEQN